MGDGRTHAVLDSETSMAAERSAVNEAAHAAELAAERAAQRDAERAADAHAMRCSPRAARSPCWCAPTGPVCSAECAAPQAPAPRTRTHTCRGGGVHCAPSDAPRHTAPRTAERTRFHA